MAGRFLKAGCLAVLVLTLYSANVHAQLIGGDSAPGEACAAKGAVRMTANAAGPGAYILTCDGDAPSGKWQATISVDLPVADEQAANKQYVDNALETGGIAACTDNDAGLCALETNRAGNDPDFVPGNIASGVNILGVIGTFTGAAAGLSGPSDCPEIGDKCTDTRIFAGFHPLTHEHLFIPPTDQGTTMQWKNATGTNDINPDSFVDGRENHVNRSGTINAFPAFRTCTNLTLAGKSWYLPSRAELDYIYNNRFALTAKAPGNGFTDFYSTYYWTSTEYDANAAWFQGLTNGFTYAYGKTDSYRVRCISR